MMQSLIPPQLPAPSVVAVWYHYEEIAMHFNSLIMQFRLQVIGGAGALGTLAGYLIGEKVKDDKERDWLRALVSTGLWVLILAAAILDLAYYNQLLRGAVDALVDFEKKYPELQMSTTIETAVGDGQYAVRWVYGLMLGVLGSFSIWAWKRHWATSQNF